MTDKTVYEDNPEWWQDGARARAFEPDASLDKLLAEAKADPGSLDRLDTRARLNLGFYEELKAGATRHNHPNPGEK